MTRTSRRAAFETCSPKRAGSSGYRPATATYAFTGSQADLGTAFALATSLFGTNQLQVSGNVVRVTHGMPTAGFRTTYSRPGAGSNPEITVTMRQMYLPSRGGFGSLFGQDGSGAALRTMSVSMLDEITLFDTMRLETGCRSSRSACSRNCIP